ncbi:MAG TPA: kinase/pyrophosphorylase [Spirochaetia bacterium]|nr:MAG: hypothetical protein A2Y41_12135 [Spirochaetes bacterium GWB1_36_13]HCL57631.1 kinase/pyrophosphorylase [Spirochaetia bacterium]
MSQLETNQEKKIYSIFVVSDATGKTAYTVVKSILVLFKEQVEHFIITHYTFVRNEQKLEQIVKRAKEQHALIVHTFGNEDLRIFFNKELEKKGVMYMDLFEKTVPTMSKFIGFSPIHNSGVQYKLTDNYFKKIEAMEFTIAHDDGQNLLDIYKSDIVLLGPSRTSKTPLSIYLANEGYKVSNIPLVNGMPIPEEVYQVDPKKIVCLIVQYDLMLEIRKKRVNYLGHHANAYASPEYIFEELEYCRDLYKKNRNWVVIDVTKKAIEETATEILEKTIWEEEIF